MNDPAYAIVPVVAGVANTKLTLTSLLGQTVNPHLLVSLKKGFSGTKKLESTIRESLASHRGVLFAHDLASLSAVWNYSLQLAWRNGAKDALIVNNDVSLHPETYQHLRDTMRRENALLVSGVNSPDSYANASWGATMTIGLEAESRSGKHGGPDFSCFLISKECHERFTFDNHFRPAYCEDLDLHRRVMLAGEGKRIFGVGLPYIHLDGGSGTLRNLTTDERGKVQKEIDENSRLYYQLKWGGPPNQETFRCPFGVAPNGEPELLESGGVTTPELQKACWS